MAATAAAVLLAHGRAAAQCELDRLIAPSLPPLSGFGAYCALSPSGRTIAIAAEADDGVIAGSGAVHVWEWDSGSWHHTAKLVAPDGKPYDQFGESVALTNDLVVVGAPRHEVAAQSRGAAYVYARTSGGWQPLQVLLAPDGESGDWFGASVAATDSAIFVGARYADTHFQDSGAVYEFGASVTGSWQYLQHIAPIKPFTGSQFGDAIAATPHTLLVGAPFTAGKGRAYVFDRSGADWVETAELIAPDAQAGDRFGESVDIDESTAMISALDDDDAGISSGSVYVYGAITGAWTYVQKLLPDDAPAPFGAHFGYSLAIHGPWAAIGQIYSNEPSGQSGKVRVYTKSGSAWVLNGPAQTATPTAQFGAGLDLRNGVLVAGAPSGLAGVFDGGTAHVFRVPAGGESLLVGTPSVVSVTSGGTQLLTLNSCVSHSAKPFLVLGSISGTQPGLGVGGLLLPLNVDGYFWLTASWLGTFPLSGFSGSLDAIGNASASVSIPAGALLAASGTTLHHAYVVLSDSIGIQPIAVSNASPLSLGP